MQFLYETPAATPVDDVVKELVDIWNMQIQVGHHLSLPVDTLCCPTSKLKNGQTEREKRFQLAGPKSCLLAKTQPQPEKDVTGGVELETWAADRTLSPLFRCVPCS